MNDTVHLVAKPKAIPDTKFNHAVICTINNIRVVAQVFYKEGVAKIRFDSNQSAWYTEADAKKIYDSLVATGDQPELLQAFKIKKPK